MTKVTVIQVIYNNHRFIEPVFSAIFAQTFKDFNVVAVISGNDDGGKELLKQKFPQVEIIDPGYNIGFAAGHNLVFDKYKSGFFQLVNPDLILEPDYISNILKAFDDPKVGAATGKLYQVDREKISNFSAKDGPIFTQRSNVKGQMLNVLDSTGVTISKSGRARDRGQHEEDRGQYDKDTRIKAVSGAGPMYRRAALDMLKLTIFSTTPSRQWRDTPPKQGGDAPQLYAKGRSLFSLSEEEYPRSGGGGEYFDEDFHSYWEDVDLTWRMSNAGWRCEFVPDAVGYHGRGAGSSESGYADVVGFIRHHKKLSPRVRQLNYQNHIFMYIKNSPYFYPQFFVREFCMFWYILFFEPGTFKILPQMLKLLPKMWKKREFNRTIKLLPGVKL